MRDALRVFLAIAVAFFAVSRLRSADDVDFARDIQPVFAESCYGCHGPQVQMAGFRLDRKPKPEIPALVLKRVTSADPAARMPMGGAPLAASKIALIRKWVEA